MFPRRFLSLANFTKIDKIRRVLVQKLLALAENWLNCQEKCIFCTHSYQTCWANFQSAGPVLGHTALEWTLPCPSISWVMATQNNLSSSFVLIIWQWWLIMTLSDYFKWPFHDDRQTANKSLTSNVMQQKYLVKMAANYYLISAMYPSIPS